MYYNIKVSELKMKAMNIEIPLDFPAHCNHLLFAVFVSF